MPMTHETISAVSKERIKAAYRLMKEMKKIDPEQVVRDLRSIVEIVHYHPMLGEHWERGIDLRLDALEEVITSLEE